MVDGPVMRADSGGTMYEESTAGFWHSTIDPSERIVLPQQVRHDRGGVMGDDMVVTIEDGAIVLRTCEDAMRLLQDDFCSNTSDGISLMEELLVERREEAAREERD